VVDDDREVINFDYQSEGKSTTSQLFILREWLKLSNTQLSSNLQTATATVGSFTAGAINICLATVHFWQCCVPKYTSDNLLNVSRLWRRRVWLWAFDVHNRCTFVERGPPKQGPIKGLLLKDQDKDKDSSYKDQDKDQDFAVKDQDLTIKDQDKDKD